MGSPLMLVVERPMTVAIPMVNGMRSQGAEMFVLTDMPALLPPPCRPLHDLLHPLPVVAPLGFHVCRQVLAEHVGLYQPVTARSQDADRHDEP